MGPFNDETSNDNGLCRDPSGAFEANDSVAYGSPTYVSTKGWSDDMGGDYLNVGHANV